MNRLEFYSDVPLTFCGVDPKRNSVVEKVAPFFLSFYPHFKQSILKSLLLNVEKCRLNREHGCCLFFFEGGAGGDKVDLGRK